MAIQSPEHRIWWKHPIERTELIWITIALVWALVMSFMMPYWHVAGRQNLSNEAYRTSPEAYGQKAEAMVAKNKVRDESNVPVVRPPPGSDVYLVARLWEWWPILELQKGQSYRLHLSSMDWQHGFSLQPMNVNVQVHPGYDLVMTVKPTEAGEYSIMCNEFCGIGHHLMTGRIHIVDR
jgi:cytochrome c oxidase subunit 2